MLQHFTPYRPITIFVLMISYVWIVFQYPIQEALHFCIHSPEIQKEEFVFHSHEVDAPGHFHHNLIVLEELAKSTDAERSPQAEQEIKKKIEIIDWQAPLTIQVALALPPAVLKTMAPTTPFKSIIGPPPQWA